MHYRVAVLVSGRGSNLQALVDARDEGLGIELVGVFSDRPKALALKRAAKAGVPALCMRVAEFGAEAPFQRALFSTVAASRPDLIVCAGFMRLIGDAALESSAPMINIHPSLLPAFRGLDTHRRVLEAGESLHGASVHRVTRKLDGGPLIAQASMPVRPGDDAETLALRLLPLEHRLLVACVAAASVGDITFVPNGDVMHCGQPLRAPLQLGQRDQLQRCN